MIQQPDPRNKSPHRSRRIPYIAEGSQLNVEPGVSAGLRRTNCAEIRAKESVGAATDGVKLAYEIHRQAMEAWHTAIKIGDPEVTEITKAGVDRATRGITEALRILEIAHATGHSTARTLEAQMMQLLMLQAEAGAEQRARATGELMLAANSQAASLKWATWALAGATVGLVLATVVLIFVTVNA